jgi:hypothetical protein
VSILSNELFSDPLALGYALFIADGNHRAIDNILQRKDIVVAGNLSVHDIKQYISIIGLRLPIIDSTTISCREFNIAIEDFKESGFNLANPLILGKITQVLDDLVAEPMIPDFTETHKLTLLSLGNKTISRAEQLGIDCSLLAISTALNGGV